MAGVRPAAASAAGPAALHVLVPSRGRSLVRFLVLPALAAALALGALGFASPWPLLWLGPLGVAALLLHREVEPRRLALRGGRLLVDAGAGLAPWVRLTPVDVTPWVLHCAVRDPDGRRRRLVVWRDAVDDAGFRRLTRAARADRWPGDPGA